MLFHLKYFMYRRKVPSNRIIISLLKGLQYTFQLSAVDIATISQRGSDFALRIYKKSISVGRYLAPTRTIKQFILLLFTMT